MEGILGETKRNICSPFLDNGEIGSLAKKATQIKNNS